MKNIKLLALAFLVLSMGLVSCSSDDDTIIEDESLEEVWDANIVEADLFGEWSIIEHVLLTKDKRVLYTFDKFIQDAACGSNYTEIKANYSMMDYYAEEYPDEECYSGTYEKFWRFKGKTFYWDWDAFDEDKLGDVYQNSVFIKGDYMKLVELEIVDEEFIKYYKIDYGETDYEFTIGEELFYEEIYQKRK